MSMSNKKKIELKKQQQSLNIREMLEKDPNLKRFMLIIGILSFILTGYLLTKL